MTKRRREMREKKEARRRRRLEAQGLMVNGVPVPPDAIPAKPAEQAPSCFSGRYYYKDTAFCSRHGAHGPSAAYARHAPG